MNSTDEHAAAQDKPQSVLPTAKDESSSTKGEFEFFENDRAVVVKRGPIEFEFHELDAETLRLLVGYVNDIIASLRATPDAPERNTGLVPEIGLIRELIERRARDLYGAFIASANGKTMDECIGIETQRILSENGPKSDGASSVSSLKDLDIHACDQCGNFHDPAYTDCNTGEAYSSPKSSCVAAAAGQEEGEWDDIAFQIARSLYGYWHGGSAGSSSALVYFDNQWKVLPGLRGTVERVKTLLAAHNASLREKEEELGRLRGELGRKQGELDEIWKGGMAIDKVFPSRSHESKGEHLIRVAVRLAAELEPNS